MESLESMTANLQLTFVIAEAKYLGEKTQSAEQQRLTLTRLLYCLNQPNVSINQKQAEDLFFNITKVFQQPSQQVHVLAIQAIRRIQPYVKSAFFATRSLVQVYEKEPSLQAPALRLLGDVSNQSSLADTTKLVRLSTLDSRNQRLIAAGALAAKRQGVSIDAQLIEKTNGPCSYIVAESIPLDKALQITVKCQNSYAVASLVPKVAASALDERKKVSTLLQFLPQTAKEYTAGRLEQYLAVYQQLALMTYNSVKPQLNQIFTGFTTIFKYLDQEVIQIAFLRHVLKLYSLAVNNQCTQSDLHSINELLKQHLNSPNQTIQTLSTIHLITSTKDPTAIYKLTQLVPQLSGELKRSALQLLADLAIQEELLTQMLPIYTGFLKQQDDEIKKCGFQSISAIINVTNDKQVKNQLMHMLIENFDDCSSDQTLSKHICDQLGQIEVDNYEEARGLAISLWQRCILDGTQLRLASIQALHKITQQYPQLRQVLDQVTKLQNDGFIKEVLVERDTQVLNEYAEELQFFNMDDLIENSANIMRNQYQNIRFQKHEPKAKAAGAQQTVALAQRQQRAQIIALNPNAGCYRQVFTNQLFSPISPPSADITVRVCKTYYFADSGDQVECMFLFRTQADEGLSYANQVLRIGTAEYPFTDGQLVYCQVFSSIGECQLVNVRMRYMLEGEEDEIKLDDVVTTTFDLASTEFDGDYVRLFAEYEANLNKYTLVEYNTLDEVIDALPNNTGLRLEDLQIEGRECQFWLLGTVYGVGQVICKCECRQLKNGGVGVRIDFRGPAGGLIQEFFE